MHEITPFAIPAMRDFVPEKLRPWIVIVNSTLAVSNIRNRTYTNCEVYLIDYGYGNFKEKIHFME